MIKRICILGVTGKMGRALLRVVCDAPDLRLVACLARSRCGTRLSTIFPEYADRLKLIDSDIAVSETVNQCLEAKPDVIIDFSQGAWALPKLEAFLEQGKPVVTGTTSMPPTEIARLGRIAKRAGVRFIVSSNFSISAVLFRQASRMGSSLLRIGGLTDYASKGVKTPLGGSVSIQRELMTLGHPEISLQSVRRDGVASGISINLTSPCQGLVMRQSVFDVYAYIEGALLAVRHMEGSARRGLLLDKDFDKLILNLSRKGALS